jgi:replicative DNA helicase
VETRATRDFRPQLSDLRECVTGETLVVLGDGQRVPIRDLVGTAPEVCAMSPGGRLVVAKSEKIWRVGMRPVFAVRLASGRVIRATGQHRLFAARGWSRVSEFSVGDRVTIARRLREQGISQRRMATLRGTAFGGNSHFRFAPSRAVLMEYGEILNDEELRGRAPNDLFWDRIIAVDGDGEEEVFDLTVPGPASWLADGIVSHNSGALEQDGDLVIFLYRPERYKKEGEMPEEERNLAEVIVGKQRNGPTGTVRLTFLPEYARFDEREEGRRQPF